MCKDLPEAKARSVMNNVVRMFIAVEVSSRVRKIRTVRRLDEPVAFMVASKGTTGRF